MKIKVIKNKDVTDYKNWSIWECEPSTFDWTYAEEEHCFILEGNVEVVGEVNTVTIEPGDYVIFPRGLSCVWKVSKAVKKHYTFK